MPSHLRWQIAVAAIGLVAIAAVASVFANRAFVDRPARGGQLVEGIVGSPVVMNPLFASSDGEVDIVRLLFCGLTKPDSQGKPVPDLATRWEISDDGLIYRFFLRRDAVWHDGEPVTADDVVFTAQVAGTKRLEPSLGRTARQWAGVEARRVDDYTVELVLDEPYAPFLGATTLGILPQHRFRDVPVDQIAQHRHSTLEPIGAGPYRLAAPGGLTEDAVQLERFDAHWAATDRQPFIEGIAFEFFSSREAAADQLGQQAIQTLGDLPIGTVADLKTGVSTYSAGEAGYTLVYLNHQRVVFRDPAVRRALSLAIDRDMLMADPEVLDGQGIPGASPIPQGSWAYDPAVTAPAYDPAMARDILSEAGWIDSDNNDVRDREGKSLSFTLGYGHAPALEAVANRLQEHWEAIGVELRVQPMEQQRVIEELTDQTYDAMLFSWVLRSYDPDPFPLWHSSQIDGGQNFSAWTDPQVDTWLAEARRTTDFNERRALYSNFQRRFAQDQPAIMLYHPLYTYGILEGIVGGAQLPRLVVEPSDRFLTLPEWFLETERVFLEEARPTP